MVRIALAALSLLCAAEASAARTAARGPSPAIRVRAAAAPQPLAAPLRLGSGLPSLPSPAIAAGAGLSPLAPAASAPAARAALPALRALGEQSRPALAGEAGAAGRLSEAFDGGAPSLYNAPVEAASEGAGTAAPRLSAPSPVRAAARRLSVGAAAAGAGLLLSAPAYAAAASADGSALSAGAVAMAFLAGLLAFLSPCTLPLIPGYVSFISGLSRQELTAGAARGVLLKKAGLGSVFFVAGFSAVFTALGATATALGSFLMGQLPLISAVGGGIVALFGLHVMGLLPIKWLYRDTRLNSLPIKPGYLGAFLMGTVFAFGWTPCIGPILSGILALAATQETVAQGVALLATFSLGLGVPFILAGLSVNGFLAFFNRYKRFIAWGERISGALLVALGVLLMLGKLDLLLQLVPEFFFRFAL